MNTPRHTPTPWKISDIDPIDGQDNMSIEFEGCPICTVRGTNDMTFIDEEDEPKIRKECLANAQLIVTAVNNHAELLEALKPFAKLADAVWAEQRERRSDVLYQFNTATITFEDLIKVKSAITKAEGKQ